MKKTFKTKINEKTKKIKGKYRTGLFGMGLIFLASILFNTCNWIIGSFGRLPVETMIYQMTLPMEGVNSDVVSSYIIKALIPSLIIMVLLYLGVTFLAYPMFKKIHYNIYYILLFALIAASFIYCDQKMSILKSIINGITPSDIYEEYYVNPEDVEIIFPEEKKNLILIYIESMETTHAEKELIPNLVEMAENNISFSDRDKGLGGYFSTPGSGFTYGALIAGSSGLPYALPNLPINVKDENEVVMPDVVTMGDILAKEGYNQAFMCGSDASFSGRNVWFRTHGNYQLCDYYQAQKDGIIEENYYKFWGFEDIYLYEYAKQKLTELSKQEEPFNLTMLTVDTHHPDGFICDICEEKYDNKYMNSIACADNQIGEFMEWVKEQDFYENTTVVILGDHISMASEYFEEAQISDEKRRVYNCFINCEEAINQETEFNGRNFTSMDLFPTILSSLNVEIEGNRLGLGTDLFSEENTVAEKIGIQDLTKELSSFSWYYFKTFVKK